MSNKIDICGLLRFLRALFFAKDRDISLAPDRIIVLEDGTPVSTSGAIIPVGGIILWSGAIVSIPSNWALCDGTGGTPDLRDQFVVGAGSSYAVDASGGSATKDLSHTHTSGTLGTDTQANHTHGVGSYAAASDSHSHGFGTLGTDTEANHTHTSGTLATDSDSHSHGFGTLVTDNDGHDHSMPGFSVVIGNESSHTHGPGTYTTGVPSDTRAGDTSPGSSDASATHTHTIASGASAAGSSHSHSISGSTYTHNHTHDVTSGSTGSDGHSHSVNSGSTGSDGGHSHSVTSGSTASDSHSHTVSGTSGTGGSHSHQVDSGSTGSGGSVAQDILPPYYALAYIMRVT